MFLRIVCLLCLLKNPVFSEQQVTAGVDGVSLLDKDEGEYKTWFERRLHSAVIWTLDEATDEKPFADKWHKMRFFMDGRAFNTTEESKIIFSWNLNKTTSFTYLTFVNEPLGPEHVRYEITTAMFDLTNASNALNTSTLYTKHAFQLNKTHISLWVNDVLAIKLFLRDFTSDIGNSKFLKFSNFKNTTDMYKLFYHDPTVYCWTDCYEDELPEKFHFDRDLYYTYSEEHLGGQCRIVNCTHDMLDQTDEEDRSEFARCVRLHHTPTGEKKQRTALKCTNENYTYEACAEFPGEPCWYEVCDNHDLCNSALSYLNYMTLLILITIGAVLT